MTLLAMLPCCGPLKLIASMKQVLLCTETELMSVYIPACCLPDLLDWASQAFQKGQACHLDLLLVAFRLQDNELFNACLHKLFIKTSGPQTRPNII